METRNFGKSIYLAKIIGRNRQRLNVVFLQIPPLETDGWLVILVVKLVVDSVTSFSFPRGTRNDTYKWQPNNVNIL